MTADEIDDLLMKGEAKALEAVRGLSPLEQQVIRAHRQGLSWFQIGDRYLPGHWSSYNARKVYRAACEKLARVL